jgi:hypothetical protein
MLGRKKEPAFLVLETASALSHKEAKGIISNIVKV